MSKRIAVTCPVSTDRINENVARTAAFFVISFTLVGLYLHNPFIFALLAIDFALRAFTNGNYSLIKFGSKQIVSILDITPKPTDAAPKKFAAGLGVFFSLLIGVLLFLGLQFSANITGAVLLFCAVLEGGFGICLGCIVYTLLIFPLGKK
jgi:hypothetical protein